MKNYRVIATHHRWKQNGEWNEERVQHLQKRKYKLFWVNIDSEIVPSHVWLHNAIFGDCDGWKSKFKDYM